MNSTTVIQVESLSKQYRLGNVGLGSLSADINRFWHTRIRGKEDPYLKVGEENNRETTGGSEYVWALRDINFNVQQGEVLGIIGRNGAGKSTLLKILSRTTGPTTGSIKIKGRVASLLEVGTGFHPELTGRENIFLNGAILGMTRHEIRSKFDEIVAFAGVERYVDTPVKRYSSGMYVRLAFAVAAHLEPEILIVDEVLAVGDAEFQKKAIGKMKEVSEGQGRTVLFVSHNMASIRNLCSKSIILQNGNLQFLGDTEETLQIYGKSNEESIKQFSIKANEPIFLRTLQILNKKREPIDLILSGDYVLIKLQFENNTDEYIIPAIGFYDIHDHPLILCNASLVQKKFHGKGVFTVYLEIKKFPLVAGSYYLNIELMGSKGTRYYETKAFRIEVEKGDFYGYGKIPTWTSGVLTEFNWTV